jgi:peptidoglycan biosynthesis protein MviN/MurJ (putative lipid II flippase)
VTSRGGPAGVEAEPASKPGLGLSAAPGVGRAALLIGGLTIVARILGFARTVVFAGTVHSSCLSAAYVTANMVPNVIYDIVLGGALTAAVVPVLAGSARRSGQADPEAAADVSVISSALLTWTIAILVPVSLALALAAGPVISLLIPSHPAVLAASQVAGCPRASLTPVATRMLVIFAPQILLYGLAVVLYGILQAHRRFTAPALAPVLSSLVMIGAYALFVPLGRHYTTRVAGLPLAAELTLAIGTTAGVAALVLTALVPAWRLRLRFRPTFRFPEGIARRAIGLAGVGIAALVAQDASMLVVTRLANANGASSNGAAVTLYSYGWQAFVSVYAVLALPLAISAFPVLASLSGPQFDEAAASATRATALASWLGAALLAALAVPVARAFPSLSGAEGTLALALVALAPGLVGFGLMACLSRVLLADGRNRIAAVAIVAGWLVVIAADVIAVPLVRPSAVVPVLGLANTAGLTVSGGALLVAVGLTRGARALRGVGRAMGAGICGAAAAATAGLAVTRLLPASGHWLNALLALATGVCALAVFAAVVALLDAGDLRATFSRARRRALP